MKKHAALLLALLAAGCSSDSVRSMGWGDAEAEAEDASSELEAGLPEASPDSPSCKPGGDKCAAYSECCSGACAAGICTLCKSEGAPCTGPSECCGNICKLGFCAACSEHAAQCSSKEECCDKKCHAGKCAQGSNICQQCASVKCEYWWNVCMADPVCAKKAICASECKDEACLNSCTQSGEHSPNIGGFVQCAVQNCALECS